MNKAHAPALCECGCRVRVPASRLRAVDGVRVVDAHLRDYRAGLVGDVCGACNAPGIVRSVIEDGRRIGLCVDCADD